MHRIHRRYNWLNVSSIIANIWFFFLKAFFLAHCNMALTMWILFVSLFYSLISKFAHRREKNNCKVIVISSSCLFVVFLSVLITIYYIVWWKFRLIVFSLFVFYSVYVKQAILYWSLHGAVINRTIIMVNKIVLYLMVEGIGSGTMLVVISTIYTSFVNMVRQ